AITDRAIADAAAGISILARHRQFNRRATGGHDHCPSPVFLLASSDFKNAVAANDRCDLFAGLDLDAEFSGVVLHQAGQFYASYVLESGVVFNRLRVQKFPSRESFFDNDSLEVGTGTIEPCGETSRPGSYY